MKNNEYGILYIVSTPIGNLKDITKRAIEILNNADIIAAEDTRHTLKLLNHLSIKKPLMSYHEHNKNKVDNKIIEILKQGKNIALVSDAGTPSISDPGFEIIKRANEEEVNVIGVPGPCAAILALTISTLKTDRFVFEGFLPNKKNERKKIIESVKNEDKTVIIYISPHSLKSTLQELFNILGKRKIVLVKELTKVHEEVKIGYIEELLNEIKDNTIKGEYVLLIEGIEKNENKFIKFNLLSIKEHFNEYIKLGYEKNDSIKKVAKDRCVSKKDIYNLLFKK
jgi:16S rRNA (cytidine1402-2'-O)-methyltransferase